MSRFWIFANHSVKGPYDKNELEKLPYFDRSALVCREDELGWWKEAENFKEFSFCKNYEILSPSAETRVDENILNAMLEKTLVETYKLKDRLSESQLSMKEKERNFKDAIERKNEEIKKLKEKIEEFADKIKKMEENSGWEKLYLEIKKRFNEKTSKLETQLAQKNEEIKKHIINKKEIERKYELEKREMLLAKEEETISLRKKISDLNDQLCEYQIKLSGANSINETLNDKVNDLKKIVFENEEEKSRDIKKFLDELGQLRTQLSKEREKNIALEKELEKALRRINELEETNLAKNGKENEIKEKLQEKISILKEYLQKMAKRDIA